MAQDTEPETATPKRFSCGCLAAVLFLGIPVTFLLLALALIVGRDSAARQRFQAEVAALRANNLPVDDKTLGEYYDERSSKENADAWVVILDYFSSKEVEVDATGIGPWNPEFTGVPVSGEWEQEKETRELLARHQSQLANAQTLAMKSQPVRFPIEFDSFSTLLPEVQKLRQMQRVFSLKTQVAIRDRDSEQTRDGLLAMFGLRRANEGVPSAVAVMVTLALDGIAIGELKAALENDVLNESDLAKVAQSWKDRPSFDDRWKHFIVTERAFGINLFNNPSLQSKSGIRSIPFRNNDAMILIDLYRKLEEFPTTNLNDFYLASLNSDREFDAFMKSMNFLDGFVTAQIAPSSSACASAIARAEMLQRLGRLGIAIRQYQKKHGELPKDLALLQEFGVDASQLLPIGDKPFGYRVEDDKAILWGFEIRKMQQTPAEPTLPDTPEIEGNTWVWEFGE